MKTFNITFLSNQFGSQTLRITEILNENELSLLKTNLSFKTKGIFGKLIKLKNVTEIKEIIK